MAGEQKVAVVNPDGSLVGSGGVSGSVSVTNFPATQAVSGTVTALPSGTQAVSGTVTTTPSGTQNVAITGQPIGVTPSNTATTPVYTTPGVVSGTNFYFQAMVDIPGVVAANNFLSIFNPAASGKTVTVYQVIVNPWATGATTADASMNVFRTTAASAGTLVAASAVNRLVTASPNPVSEVRIGNPTTTNVGTTLIGFPPAITTAGAGISANGGVSSIPGASFTMTPGQGIVFNTSIGDVDQRWNIQFIWAEQ